MADSVVEPSSSSSVSSIQGPTIQTPQSTVGHGPINQNIIPIITGEIQVDNTPRPPPSTASNATANVADDTEEPEIKRKRLDTALASTSLNEKLESRLGGILCCAVCLDLPKTFMYQVGRRFDFLIYHFSLTIFFCSFRFVFRFFIYLF